METAPFTEPWKQFAESWQRITSPGRPTPEEIEIYLNFSKPLLERHEPRVLIMGATPELREMLAPYQESAQITLADINIEMIQAMTSLVENPNKNEIWIRSNWLEVPVPENYFDLILADFTYENLPFELQDRYFANITRWLKQDGKYVGRTRVYKPSYQPLPIEELLTYCQEKEVTPELANLFYDTGTFFTGEMTTKAARVDQFLEKLSSYLSPEGKYIHPNENVTHLLNYSRYLYPTEKMWFKSTESDFKELVGKHLTLEDWKSSESINLHPHYLDTAPIVVLSH